jgi:hypothetical protein
VELSRAVTALEEKKSIAAEQGKEMGMKQMAVLKDKIRGLESILKDFTTDSDSVGVACVGIFVIETQINVLKAHGKALGERYGGWESTPQTTGGATIKTAAAEEKAPSAETPDNNAAVQEITPEILEQYTGLKEETSRLEAAIDKAAEEEDYEAAAALEEQLESARAGIAVLGISSDALENALANGFASSTNDEGEQDLPEESTSPQNDTDESATVDDAAKSDEMAPAEENDTEVSATADDATKSDEATLPPNEIEDEKKISEDRTETADEPETVNSVDCDDVDQEE